MILKHDLHTTQGGVVLQQQQCPDTSALSGRDFQFSDPDASSSDTTESESESERPIESRKMDSLMNDTESMFGLNCASCQIHKASLNQAKEQINNLVHKLGLAQNEILELQSTVNLLHKPQAKHTSSSISNRLSPFSWMKKEQQTHTDNNPNNSGSLPQVPVNLNAEQNIQEVKRLRNLVLQLESEKEALTLSTHALSQEVRALTIAAGSKSTLPATTSVQISGHVTPHSTRSPPHEKQLVLSLKKATLIDFDDRDISPYSSQYTESSMGGMEISRSVSQLASARKQGGAYGNAMRLLRERDEKIRELTLELGNMYSLLATKDDELTALMAGVEVQEYKHTKSDGNSSLLFEKVWTPTASRAARRHSNFTTIPLDVMYSQEPSLCEQHALRDHHERVHPQIDDFVSRSQEQLEAMNETIVQNYSLLSTTLQDFGSVVAKSRGDESSTTLKQSECVSCHNEEFSERLEILQEENNFFAQMLGLLYQIQNRNIWNIVQEKEYRLMEYERLSKLVHEEKDRRNSIMGQVELFYYGVLHDTNIFIRKQLPKSDRKDLSLENVSKIQDENLRLLSELKPLKVQMVEYQALTDRLGVRYPFPSHYIGSAIVRLNSLQPC